MEIYNISDPEDLYVLKHNIEKYLLDTKQIDKKYNIYDFINKYANLTNKIYIYNNEYIPFEYYILNNIKYLIIGDNKNVNVLINKLEKINFNFTKLKKLKNKEILDLIENDTFNSQFIINNEYYI